MLAELKSMLSDLKNTNTFNDWLASHNDAFLSSCFIVDNQGWQLAFYSPSKNKISTFLKDKLIQADSAIFKYKDDNVEMLNLDDIKTDLDDALMLADKELQEKHPGYKPNKKLVVLQKLGKTLWNITYLTSSFNIFNIKIDAIDKKVISQDFSSAMHSNPKKNPNLP